jgi:hypothetical protein
MKIAYLCYNIKGNNYTEDNIDNSCYFNYYKDLGLGLTVAGWEDKAYDAVLSVYISTPLWVRKLSSPYSFPTNDNTVPLRKPLDGLSFADAVRIADKHNPVVRQYFRSVLNEKLKNDEDFLLSPELNPRLWPIRFRMTHLESRVVKTCDEPPTFKWSGHE